MPETIQEQPPRGFKRFRKKAAQALEQPERVQEIAKRAGTKLEKHRGRLRELRSDMPLLIRLTRAWFKKEYREVPWKTLVAIVAALIYFISPVDFLPDLIPFFGFIDDAAVVAYVLKSFQTDLNAFREWEATAIPTESSSTPSNQGA